MISRTLFSVILLLFIVPFSAQLADEDGNGENDYNSTSLVFQEKSIHGSQACTNVLLSFPAPTDTCQGLAYDGESLWLASNNYIRELAPTDGAVISTIPSHSVYPGGLAYDGNDLWMSDRNSARLIRLDRTDGSILTEYNYPQFTGEKVLGLTYHQGELWFGVRFDSQSTDSTYRVSASSGDIISRHLALGDTPSGMASDGDFLYYADNGGDVLGYIIDPFDFSLLTTFQIPGSTAPNGLAYDGTDLWVMENVTNMLYKVEIAAAFHSSATACDSYTWNGVEYVQSGHYTHYDVTSSGCDSISVLDLTLNYGAELYVDYFDVCDGVEYQGQYLTEPGQYTFEEENDQGCIDVVHITIGAVYQSTSSESIVTACGPYEWNGVTYMDAGTYEFETINTNGCDSTAVLVLDFAEFDLSIQEEIGELIATEESDSYQWLECGSGGPEIIQGETNQILQIPGDDMGSYAVILSQGACMDTTECLIASGVDDIFFESHFRIYPNPSAGIFAIETVESFAPLMISVSDVLGRIIYREVLILNSRFELNVPGESGLYFVEIRAEDNRKAIFRILKE